MESFSPRPFDEITTINLIMISTFTFFLIFGLLLKNPNILQKLSILYLFIWSFVHVFIPAHSVFDPNMKWEHLSMWLGTYEMGFIFNLVLFLIYVLNSNLLFPTKNKQWIYFGYLFYLLYGGSWMFLVDNAVDRRRQDLIWNLLGMFFCLPLLIFFGLKRPVLREESPLLKGPIEGSAIRYSSP